jgi:hypothetical protein
LEQTPGYQFNLSQGLKATQSAAAAKGLGVSGAALKGAATYATGLADSTYQNQFNNSQQIYTDLFNKAQQGYSDYFNLGSQDMSNRQSQINALMNATTIGQNAAAQVGSQGVQSAANGGNFLTQAGNAQASGAVGGANALTSGLGNTFNQLQGQNLLSQLTGGKAGYNVGGALSGLFGGGGYSDTGSWTTPDIASGGSIFG